MKRKKLKHEFVLLGCLFTKFTWSRQLKIYIKKTNHVVTQARGGRNLEKKREERGEI
jgi:hypothetical protein